jgi:hypothetical protein
LGNGGSAGICCVELFSEGALTDEGCGDVDKTDVCDGASDIESWESTMGTVPLVADGLRSPSFDKSDSPRAEDSCSAEAASRSSSSLSCSMLVRSQRAMSNGSNRREEDTSHQHRSARRMTAGSGAVTDDERAAVRTVAKVAFVAHELDRDESRGTGCQ